MEKRIEIMTCNNGSAIMYRMKAIALYSIVLAHSPYTNIQSEFFVNILARVATIGVFAFFWISGYYYTKDGIEHKYSFIKFLKKKLCTTIIPWIINASIYYGLIALASEGNIRLTAYLNFILGNGSLFYYMTMLCGCYLVVWKLVKHEGVLWMLVVINIISVLLTAKGILGSSVYAEQLIFTYLNPYLNIFNWIGIFSFGVLAKRHNLLQHLINLEIKISIMFILICASVSVLLIRLDNGNTYWTNYSLLIECMISCCIVLIVKHFPYRLGRWLEYVGTITLPIYFWHILIVNRVLNIGVYRGSIAAAVVRPIITIIGMSIVIYIIQLVASKLKINRILQIIVGVRI